MLLLSAAALPSSMKLAIIASIVAFVMAVLAAPSKPSAMRRVRWNRVFKVL
jgi:hypothetical protein